MAWDARWRVGSNLGVESGCGVTAFIHMPVVLLMLLTLGDGEEGERCFLSQRSSNPPGLPTKVAPARSLICHSWGRGAFVRGALAPTRSKARLQLGDEASFGGEQGGIDGSRPLEGFAVDRDVDQGIETAHRADVAHFGPLNAQVLGLAVDAFGAGALVVNDAVERAIAIEGDAHLCSCLQARGL